MRIVEACTINRTLHKLVCTYNNLSKSGLTAINEYIRNKNAVQIFKASWNSISHKNDELVIKITFQLLDVQQKLQSDNVNIQEELCFLDEITEPKHMRALLHGCFEEYLNVQIVNLSTMGISDFEVIIISDCLMLNTTVNKLNLSNNNIKIEAFEALAKAIEVNVTLQNLDISGNKISDDGIVAISNSLKVNKALNKLNLSNDKITDKGIIKFIRGVKVNTALQNLDISHNAIFDDGIVAISDCLKINSTLCKLNVSGNKITDEGAKGLTEAIKVNKTLQGLNISKNCISKEGVMRIVEACTINRTLHKLVCTHNNLSQSGLAAINEYIRKENALQVFDASWNSFGNKYNYYSGKNHLAIKTTFQLLDVQHISQNRKEELWFIEEAAETRYVKELLHCCLDVQHVSLAVTVLTDFQMLIFCDCLMINGTVKQLDLSSNEITDEGAKRIAEAIKVNRTLQGLNISKNWISKEGVMRIVEACTINRTLHKLVCTHNNLSKSGLTAINEYIRKENALQTFHASWNSVIASSRCGLQLVITTFQSLRSPDDGCKTVWFYDNVVCHWENIPYKFTHGSLTELNLLKYNMQSNEYFDIIQGVMQVDTLHKLIISHNRISDDVAIAFSECLKTNTTLIELDMSQSSIRYRGASAIAGAMKVNTTLQKLNIS